ncbi:MAG: hypothetical protein KA410_05915, partial [Streptococcus sp.]|nr:hypothetical protein [Streptococcus sp.]
MNRKTIYEDLIQFDYFSDSYLQFEKDFNKYYKGVDPLTFLIDDILLTMAMKQKNYFRLHKSKATDGRDHYFIFKVKTMKENPRIRIYEYQEMRFSV